jgi:hypothetical protein
MAFVSDATHSLGWVNSQIYCGAYAASEVGYRRTAAGAEHARKVRSAI